MQKFVTRQGTRKNILSS